MKEKDFLKSNKFYGLTKTFSLIAMLGVFAGGILTFAGCGNTQDKPPIIDDENKNNAGNQNGSQNNGQNNNQGNQNQGGNENQGGEQTPPENQGGEQTPPVQEPEMNLDEFLEKHPDLAKEFADNLVNELSYSQDILSTSYQFVSEGDKLTGIKIANVVKTGDTEREVKVATISIVGGVEFEKLVEGNAETVLTIESETVLSFDAKEVYKQQSDIKSQIDEVVDEYLGEDCIETQDYLPETFVPQTVAELVQDYPEIVNKVLNEHFLDDALKTGRTTSLDGNLIKSAKWYLNGENEIESLDFVMTYDENVQAERVYAYGLSFDETINIQDIFNNQNLAGIVPKKSQHYSFSYFKDVQGSRDDLMNAIFKAYGMSDTCPEGAIRLIRDHGDTLSNDIGEVRDFTVVEITESKISEFIIRIKRSKSDVEYVEKLLNKKNYISNKELYLDINGYYVEYVPTTTTVKPTSAKPTKMQLPHAQQVVSILDNKKYME